RRRVAGKRALAAGRSAPRREVEEAEAAATTARADAAAAEAALHALGISGSDTQDRWHDSSTFVLRSPIAGTVIDRSGAQGEMADPSRSLYRIADLSRLWLTVHAFERDACPRTRAALPPVAHCPCLRARRGTARAGHHRARAVRRPSRPHLHRADHERRATGGGAVEDRGCPCGDREPRRRAAARHVGH